MVQPPLHVRLHPWHANVDLGGGLKCRTKFTHKKNRVVALHEKGGGRAEEDDSALCGKDWSPSILARHVSSVGSQSLRFDSSLFDDRTQLSAAEYHILGVPLSRFRSVGETN